MTTPEILLLTGAAAAALGLFALGVLVGLTIGESRAARAYVDDLHAQLPDPPMHAQIPVQMPATGRVAPRPVSVTDHDPTVQIERYTGRHWTSYEP